MNKATLVLVLFISMRLYAPIGQVTVSDPAHYEQSTDQVAMLGRKIDHLERSLSGYHLLMSGLIVIGGICLAVDLYPHISRDGNNSSVIFPLGVTTICVLRLIQEIVDSKY